MIALNPNAHVVEDVKYFIKDLSSLPPEYSPFKIFISHDPTWLLFARVIEGHTENGLMRNLTTEPHNGIDLQIKANKGQYMKRSGTFNCSLLVGIVSVEKKVMKIYNRHMF